MITKKEDGSVKLLVFRKKTHTDQYLHFTSHHPLQHKLSVVRTLLDRCNTLVTEEEDRVKEEEHVRGALVQCGYPNWTFKQVKRNITEKKNKENNKKKNKEKQNKSKGMVVIPYVKGL